MYVRQVLDRLDQAVRGQGREPHPYSVLTERARAAAESWLPDMRRPGS